jgi:hypothetical protein
VPRYQRIVATIARTIEIMIEIDVLMLPALSEIDSMAATTSVDR